MIYRVQSATPRPDKVRRIHGLKARLIGRDRELKQMEDAAMRLRRKEGTVLTVSGDAGTGKSRLITEFKGLRMGGCHSLAGRPCLHL
jgi:DNA-binding NtrC family response regulator